MTITYLVACIIITFIAGFRLGKHYILKGLSLRAQQLYAEGSHAAADFYKKYWRVKKIDERFINKN